MEEKVIPHEVVDLPSLGLLYPTTSLLSSGKVKIKYPRAAEEDILTNINYIRQGVVFDRLLESLIIDKIDLKDLLMGDKNAILIAARILAYGKDYKVAINNHPVIVDLTKVDEKQLDKSLIKTAGVNEFYFTLPNSGIEISFKLTTGKDEEAIEKELEGLRKIKPDSAPNITTRLKHIILSVAGKRDTKSIREFVDEMFSRDSKALREYINKITPDIEIIYQEGSEKGQVPITMEFFWPE